jgi:hypothetical protein
MYAPLGAEAVLADFITGAETAVKLNHAARTQQYTGKRVADSRRRSYGQVLLNPNKA